MAVETVIPVSHNKHLYKHVLHDRLLPAFEDVCIGTELENMGSQEQFTPTIH